jgi:MFS superfamily sulfate permease-like transporter
VWILRNVLVLFKIVTAFTSFGRRFESSLYFASQERFKRQLYKRVADPRRMHKQQIYNRQVVVEVDVDEKAPTTTLSDKQAESEKSRTQLAGSGGDKGEQNGGVVGDGDGAGVGNGNSGATMNGGSSKDVEKSCGGPGSLDGTVQFKGSAEKARREEDDDEEEDGDESTANPSDDAGGVRYVVLDLSAVLYVDLAGVDVLATVIAQFSRVGVPVLLANVPSGTLSTLRRAGLVGGDSGKVGEDKVFYSVFDALRAIQAKDRIVVKF